MDKTHHDELIDSSIKYAGTEMLIKLAKETPSEKELADFEIPSKNIEKRISASINKEVRKRYSKRALKMSLRVAAILLIFVIASSVAIASSEALRVKFFNIFKTSDKISDTISINDDTEESDVILPGYLPEGYHYVSGSETETMAVSIYDDSNGNTIFLSRRQSIDTITYDTENSTTYETKIDGNKALVVTNPEINNIYYYGDSYVYLLSGIVDVDELISIIKSLPK